MKKLLFVSCLLFFTSEAIIGQLDNPKNNSVNFEKTENDVKAPVGYELPAINKPRFQSTDGKNPNTMRPLPKIDEEDFDMSKDDGLLEYKTNKRPKYFTKDKEAKKEYGRDQFLGDFLTTAAFVNVVYRDHEYVDGDMIRIFVNGDVIRGQVTLDGSFRGFDLPLLPGENRIDFEALNQGDSGPNTAELHVYDDKGMLVSAHEWNLLTGNKASIIVYKQ
ncbi:MAG: hypothetical protein ACI83B_002137 [Sediminicola sp.]|jgi:hypothetical protein